MIDFEHILSIVALGASLLALNSWRHERRSIIASDAHAAVLQADIAIARCYMTAREMPEIDPRDDSLTTIAQEKFKSVSSELAGAIRELLRVLPQTKARFPDDSVAVEAMWMITYGVARAWGDWEAQLLYNTPSSSHPDDWSTYELPWNCIFAEPSHKDVVGLHSAVRSLVTAVGRWAKEEDAWWTIREPRDDAAYEMARRFVDDRIATHLGGFGMRERPPTATIPKAG